MSVYHYTDLDGAAGIMRTRKIRMSTGGKGDAFFGQGVYLTEVPPDVDRSILIRNNWDDGRRLLHTAKNRVDFFFKFDRSDLPGIQKCPTKSRGRNIWVNHHEIDLEYVEFEFGQTEYEKGVDFYYSAA